ncbi:MAG TPA: zinc ribbon domain-containing protein, partial [Steroidobacteraceae bacterium]
YEYQCKSCGHELEAMQKVSEAPLKKCPHCGKSQLQRLMSAPVFRLKGGGWYETDFKGDKDNQRNLADRPEEAPKDTKDTDSKAKDEKGGDVKDVKTADTKPSDAPTKEAKTTEKPADKPADKSSNAGAQKPGAAKSSSRGGRPKKKAVKLKRRG